MDTLFMSQEQFDEYEDERTGVTRVATMADAHVEWHRNAGVPMGQPGCPQDACHDDDRGLDPEDDYCPPEFYIRCHHCGYGHSDVRRARYCAEDHKYATVPIVR
jgi:hypothetical protein